MFAITFSHVSKSFRNVNAVQDVTFEVQAGQIFGLLGPNGAGKTTILRLLLDIIKPDQGEIHVLGSFMDEAKKDRIGYMPEERGLYQDAPLERILVYMATLKGLPARQAKERVQELMELLEIAPYRRKKIKDLSKGMQQKAQIIATIAHKPELLIIDEPFSGLDPLNARTVKKLLMDLNSQGSTVLMSTHQLHQVEEMCERILLLDHGQAVLYGQVDEIRQQFSRNSLLLRTSIPLPTLDGIAETISLNGDTHLVLQPGVHPRDILQQLVAADVTLEKFELALPSLDDIFLQAVEERKTQA